ncbi:MAG: protease modulator HflC [Gammaproteobacteria bacterium]|nr:protease modulator HflC [Gammaproteobacteria bacterium]
MAHIKFIGIGVLVVLLLLTLSVFTVNEGESALILQLGRIVNVDGAPLVVQPGLHFKTPFIDKVRVFDTRVQQLATSSSQPLMVVTKEQTYLVVDYFAKWRINNLPKFYTSTGGSVSWAENLLEQRINDVVRAEYGRHTSDQAISADRTSMIAAIKEQADHIGQDQGISVIDVQIQQITMPKDVMDSVFKRMATERKQFAEAKRATGMEKSEEIKALADQKATVIKAEALLKAANARAQGDQEAAGIFARAYTADPKFYSLYRSLEAYTKSFHSKSDVLVIKPEGQFFNYFHHANAQSETTPAGKR